MAEGPEAFASPPSFFVVGAQKAGTSSVHAALAELDEVSLPSIKETHFFSTDEHFARGWSWYRGWFERDAPGRVTGEVDPAYLDRPEAAERIRAALPGARVVVLVREPLERAFSHHGMSVARGYEELGFGAALAAEEDRLAGEDPFAREHHGYLLRSRYVEWLRAWRAAFPAEQVLVLRFDELVAPDTARPTLARLLRHVGIERDAPPVLERRNPASRSRSRLLNRLLYGDSRVRRLLRPVAPLRGLRLRVAMRLDRWNRKPLEHGALLDLAEVDPRIVARVRSEVEELQDLLEQDLTSWLARYASPRPGARP